MAVANESDFKAKALIDAIATELSQVYIILYTYTYIYTVSQKNDAALACYNFDVHQRILIVSGRNVAKKKKLRSQMVPYFPTSPN